MSNQNNMNSALGKIKSIHEVDGFDPSQLAVEYTDFNTGETRSRLPVMAQLAWFRLVYPQGKISVSATPVKDHYVAQAKVYPNYNDPPDAFLAEATASRKYDQEKPTVSPREWAQTAAIGIALRNAGFGLQFSAAGDAFDQPAVDEIGELIQAPASLPKATPEPEQQELVVSEDVPDMVKAGGSQTPAETPEPEQEELEDPLAKAMNMVGPLTKNGLSGKTLGEIARIDPKALVWVATKYTGNPEVAEGAKLICEASQLASA